MSTLLPAHLAPSMDQGTRDMINEHTRRSAVDVLNGELVVHAPGACITFAKRDKSMYGKRALTANTRFVLTGIPLPKDERAYQRSVIIALFDIATGAFRSNAPDRIARKYAISSFVTRLTLQPNGGLVSDLGPCFRATGYVCVNNQIVDLIMKIL